MDLWGVRVIYSDERMPEVTITDRQLDRLAAVRDDLAEVFVGEYGSIRDQDAIEYLLDTYSPPTDDSESSPQETGDTTAESDKSDAADGAERLKAMMEMLTDYEDKWREAESGDEPYEVELPDGSMKGARTKDDVRRLLFQYYHS